ncbi:hypothetical protein LJK87_07360 [Paenibacillus sp. P25]|nr:hypothetical protein LJK87_07360 [Paenibacillus sp. P25]
MTGWTILGFSITASGITRLLSLVNQGETVEGTSYVAGASFVYPAETSEKDRFSRKAVLNDASSPEYRLGEMGRSQPLLDGKLIGTVPIYAADSPRLKLKDGSAFSFRETGGQDHTWAQKYMYILQALTRVLFTGKAE